jgi:hypothetical protein
MEIKWKNNGTYTLKGLTEDHINAIYALVSHVRLGDGTPGSDAAYDLCELFEQEGFEDDDTELTVTTDEPIHYTIELN